MRRGEQSGFRAGFRPDSVRESFKIGPKAGRMDDFQAFPIKLRPKPRRIRKTNPVGISEYRSLDLVTKFCYNLAPDMNVSSRELILVPGKSM